VTSNLLLWENPAFLTRVDEWVLSGCPDQNSIDWTAEPWIVAFPEHKDFLQTLHTKYLGFLNRDIVKRTVQGESEDSKYIEGFLVVMIWGYASDYRGPYKTKQILSQDNALESIEKAYLALLSDDVVAAYSALVTNGPKYLGPAFASKYLYFASQQSVMPTPLILDSQVAEGLSRWGNMLYNSITASAKDYLDYLDYMKFAADKISIREEDLEFLVFSENAKLKGNQSWANRASEVYVSDTEKRAWAFLLASEILLRDPNLVAHYSQPGGGQYDCISIREIEKRTGLEADFNISGSIHFFEPVVNHYSWETLISRGVSGTCEMLAPVYGWEHSVDLEKASPWAKSFRSMAKFAINNASDASIRYECLVVDNSAYGLSIDTKIFEQYPTASVAKERYPNLWRLPKEAWFWKVLVKDEIVGLIDTFSGLHYYKEDDAEDLNWPN
jgi:hypothetical protein